MDRHFILAGSFAAVLHGALFTLPRGPVPPVAKDITDVIALDPRPFDILEDPEPVVDVVANQPTGGGSSSSRQIDAPQPDRGGWTVPVEVYYAPVKPGPDLTPGPMGPPGDIRIPGTGPGPMSVVSLDRPPRACVQVSPAYPADARRDGRSGTVTVEFVVDEGGHVHSARVVDSSDRVFNDAAVRAVSKWRFEPGTVDGKIVRFRMAVPVVFNLGA